MPQKTLNLSLALIGACIVTVLLLVGIDAWRSARTGPRWKRRLFAAGLALLGTLGVIAYQEGSDTMTCYIGGPMVLSGRSEFRATPEWKHLLATWREAEEVASGKRGAYPFDEAGKKTLLGALEKVDQDITALTDAEQLDEAEAGLLRVELARLTQGVQAKRPTEMKMATCYEPMVYLPAQDSLKRLEARLPLLRSLAATGKLKPEVSARVLAAIEQDLTMLTNEEEAGRLPEPDRKRAATLRAEAAQALESLKNPGQQTGLQRSEDWQTVSAAWVFASPLATSGKSTMAQRKELDERLKAARAALDRLAKANLLTAEEARLLADETANIRSDVYREPPTDSQVECYDMAYTPPAQLSYGRLSQRLPLIRKLVEGKKVHPEACAKILVAVRSDLATLSNPELTRGFTGPNATKLEDLRKQVTEAVDRLERLLTPVTKCYLMDLTLPKDRESSRNVERRLKHLAALEAQGKLRPEVAELARSAIRRTSRNV